MSLFTSKQEPAAPSVTPPTSGGVPQIRIVFMGTPPFAATLLGTLVDAGYSVVGVFTKPDAPTGREQTLSESAVKQKANELTLPVVQPARLDAEALKTLKEWRPDLILVAAYGKILPQTILAVPSFGCVNVHASLLPRWRGASPIQNALLSGDTETGVTLMLMDEGMDTGPLLAARKIAISSTDDTPALTEKLATVAQGLLLETLPAFIERSIAPQPQDSSQATLCQLIEREDGRLFWNSSAADLVNRSRALTPWPGVYAFWKRDQSLIRIKLFGLKASFAPLPMSAHVGEVVQLDAALAVQAGEGVVFFEGVQVEGKKQLSVQEFRNGNPDFVGSILE